MILSVRAIVITCLAVVSTMLCLKYDILADFPMSLIGTAVIFPIVFSIGGAYKRREVALREYGGLKAHGRAIFFAARDWLEVSDPEATEEVKGLLKELLSNCRELFKTPVEKMEDEEVKVYESFSKLSLYIKSLRKKGLASGEASRCNQFLSKMAIAFENVKHIYQYRTPRTLRAYSRVFITVLPILYGPYFAAIGKEYSQAWLTYIMPVLLTLVLTSLDNIQEHLENPFDQIGEDDVAINVEKFVSRLGD